MNTKLLSTDRPIKISYAYKENILSFSSVGDSNCSVSISGEWNEVNTSIGSIKLEEKTARSSGGFYYESILQIKVPGHDSNTPQTTNQLLGRKVLVKIEYRSGIIKIIGNKINCPVFLINQNSSDSTYREIEFSFKSSQPNKHLLVS